MIRRTAVLDRFEQNLIAREPADLQRSVRIAEGMYQQACALGVWPPADPLDGIDVVIRVAKVMRRVSRSA